MLPTPNDNDEVFFDLKLPASAFEPFDKEAYAYSSNPDAFLIPEQAKTTAAQKDATALIQQKAVHQILKNEKCTQDATLVKANNLSEPIACPTGGLPEFDLSFNEFPDIQSLTPISFDLKSDALPTEKSQGVLPDLDNFLEEQASNAQPIKGERARAASSPEPLPKQTETETETETESLTHAHQLAASTNSDASVPSRAQPAALDPAALLSFALDKNEFEFKKKLPGSTTWPQGQKWHPLGLCAHLDWTEGVDACIGVGISPDATNYDAISPLQWALAKKSWNAMSRLFFTGANPSIGVKKPFINALVKAQAPAAIISMAIKAGAPNDAFDLNGELALHAAARLGDQNACLALILSGSLVKTPTTEGSNSIELAKKFKHLELSYFLQRHANRQASSKA